MFDEESLVKLVQETGGFEVALGFRNDVDHFMGGAGNKLWYFVQKGTAEDYYVCTLDGSAKGDVHFTRKNKALSSAPAPAGKTIELILAELAVGQQEVEGSSGKPTQVEVCGHPCSHYSFAFGERAYKISDEFGVTVEYSNLSDEEAGFRLRNIFTGPDATCPAEG